MADDMNTIISQAVANAITAASVADFDPRMRNQFAVVPEGYELKSLEPHQDGPDSLMAQHTFDDVESLVVYLRNWATPTSMFKADADRRRIMAVIDYHESADMPARCRHKVEFQARLHPVMALWLGACDRTMSQLKFGRFLEDRAKEVVEPDAASVMEMVMTFDAIKKVSFRSSQRLHDGRRQFHYVEENEARGGLTLPESFVVETPIFAGAAPEYVKFMVRYDISDGDLTFKIEMHDKDIVLNRAFEGCVTALRDGLEGHACASNPIYRVI